ncbi:1156_t:CDS:2 [Paraglomus occultum]|uniref:1156_t:CDS:1 n=1 Tax=Paraglomus occultum TaxID=144539 RepID=A0A9N9AN98_9GLOM|nr:1156_t:CDS:2 [Paraglomus occultum]
MTKLLRLTLIALAVIVLANVVVSMPLPVNKRFGPVSDWGEDRIQVTCNRRRACPPHLDGGGGHKGPSNSDPSPPDGDN